MSILKTNSIQIGQSNTASENFTLTVPAVPDGSVKLSRGNPGATTSDILTIDSSGNVSAPNNLTVTGTLNASGANLTNLPAIGVGQTWQDVTASRALATTYTNSTGKPILVIVSVQHGTNTGTCNVTVGGIVVSLFETNISYAGSMKFCQSFIVPNSTTYSVSANQTLLKWTELR